MFEKDDNERNISGKRMDSVLKIDNQRKEKQKEQSNDFDEVRYIKLEEKHGFFSNLLDFIVQRVIIVGILLMLVILVVSVFLWHKQITGDKTEQNNGDLVVEDGKTFTKTNREKEEKNEKQTKKEFTEFGDFWIEINTDDLKIKAPIVEGVTDYKLSQGVGHHKTTARPNREKGNVVLSGHRWFDRDEPAFKVFENLDKLKIGDKVKVHYKEEDFVYEVFDTKIVPEDAVEILDQTEEPILTLYTCTPKNTAEKRLVFLARLIK